MSDGAARMSEQELADLLRRNPDLATAALGKPVQGAGNPQTATGTALGPPALPPREEYAPTPPLKLRDREEYPAGLVCAVPRISRWRLFASLAVTAAGLAEITAIVLSPLAAVLGTMVLVFGAFGLALVDLVQVVETKREAQRPTAPLPEDDWVLREA